MGDFERVKGGDRTVRVEDVARVAGVSPITVSRALRTPDLVRPETRAKVEAAVLETGYVINPIASSLRSGQSSFVAVFVASLQNLHYAAAMQGLFDAFEGTRFRLMFSQAGYAEDIGAEQVRAMLPFKPAAIVFSGIVRDEGARQFLRSLEVPVMEMWGESAQPIDMLVMSPAREGGRLMGRHFGDQGFGRIAYVGHAGSRGEPRIAGFREGLAETGREISLLLPSEGNADMADGVAVLDILRRKLPDCDAVLFGTDVMAAGALVRLAEEGVAVPDDLAVAGYGDLFFASHTRPTLTSVRTSPYDVGLITGEALLERLTTGSVPNPVIQVSLQLKVRASTLRDRTKIPPPDAT